MSLQKAPAPPVEGAHDPRWNAEAATWTWRYPPVEEVVGRAIRLSAASLLAREGQDGLVNHALGVGIARGRTGDITLREAATRLVERTSLDVLRETLEDAAANDRGLSVEDAVTLAEEFRL